MDFSHIKAQAAALFSVAPYLAQITNEVEYKTALALLDELIDDYDNHRPLITVISHAIKQWEDRTDEFAEFNTRINAAD